MRIGSVFSENGYIEETLYEVFEFVDETMIKAKSALIGLCSEIDRFLQLTIGVDISKKINEAQYEQLFYCFPKIRNIPSELLDNYFKLINDIRNMSAHLFLANKLYVRRELLDELYKIAEPLYQVEKDGMLTVYGVAYTLSFVSLKYQVWPFITAYFNKTYIHKKGDEVAKIQIEMEHHIQSYCGVSKPIYPKHTELPNMEINYLNELVKSTLTSIFFKLEAKLSYGNRTRETDNRSFKHILTRSKSSFSMILINRLCALRNSWLHGTWIFDEIVYGSIPDFKFDTIVSVLYELKQECKYDENTYKTIIQAVDKFGDRLCDFCGLRLVETSFKLLDNVLFEPEKIEERISNGLKAFARLEETNKYGLIDLANKIVPEGHKYVVAAAKFIDKLPRYLKTTKMTIYKVHSNERIVIEDYETSSADLCFCLFKEDEIKIINRDTRWNRINGLDVSEMKATFSYSIGSSIDVYEVMLGGL